MTASVTASPPPAATLLAAGLGLRLGGMPKSALLIDGQSLFERLAQALRQAGIDNISAVIGPYAETLVPLALRSGVRVVHHRVPDVQLVQSQRLAVQDHMQHQFGRDLMLLVADLPLLTSEHVVHLLDAWRERPSQIHAQVPMVHGVRGHPVCLSWPAVQAVAQPFLGGVREWLIGAGGATQVLDTVHEAYITDLDTTDDLDSVRRRLHPLSVVWPSGLLQTAAPAQPLA